MSSEDFPPWLKAMQNGSIGEARTRAFLMDRFWILERSVDIDGADFVIQRRMTSTNLLDKTPPRFGVVQAKYFASKDTTHNLPSDYAIDANGEIRNEFFVVCHTGSEEQSKIYLLTAEDMISDFDLVDGKIHISGRKLLTSSKYEIKHTGRSLERIERALKLADFRSNRSFVRWFLPCAELEQAIEPIYRESIDNWWGDIPEGFLEMKKKAQKAIDDLEDVHRQLTEIVRESDPEKALAIAEILNLNLRGRGGLSVSISEDLYIEDLHYAVLHHKEKVNELKNYGLLDPYITLKSNLLRSIVEDLAPRMPLENRYTIHRMNINYDPNSFEGVNYSGSILDARELNSDESGSRLRFNWIEHSKPGNIVACWLPECFTKKEQGETWAECVSRKAEMMIRDIHQAIYERWIETS
ncbi:MAG: hypothetical protein HZB44_03810 [Actinobacteria bacterium]|nr:hypothetical protein [Actinomycetota bacterium]